VHNEEFVDVSQEDIERIEMLPFFLSSGAQVTHRAYQGYPGEQESTS